MSISALGAALLVKMVLVVIPTMTNFQLNVLLIILGYYAIQEQVHILMILKLEINLDHLITTGDQKQKFNFLKKMNSIASS